MKQEEIELLTLISDLVNSKDTGRKSIGSEVKRLTESLRAALAEREKRIEQLEDGIITTLKYPRGSEAQIRCLEEVAYYAKLKASE